MEQLLRGKALVLGNNIDTDQIYPGRFLELTDHKQIGSHCFAGIDEAIAPGFPKGGIVVAGRNFGCGSSREHAPIALLNMGAAAVVADVGAFVTAVVLAVDDRVVPLLVWRFVGRATLAAVVRCELAVSDAVRFWPV